ncbi:MAG: hypothetical protein ACFFAK_18265 [Promethearchaeota archaeon]
MKKVEQIERLVQHNQNLANHERELAKKEKILAKNLRSRTKARKSLIKKEVELAKIRKSLAEKNQELVNKRLEISQEHIIDFPEKLLNHEKEYTIFNEKLSENLIELANLYLKVIKVEESIANERGKLADSRLKMARIREILAQEHYKYAKAVKAHANNEVIVKAEMDYLNKEKDLKKIYTHIEKDVEEIIKKKDELAEISKEISLKFAEREKIRLHEI